MKKLVLFVTNLFLLCSFVCIAQERTAFKINKEIASIVATGAFESELQSSENNETFDYQIGEIAIYEKKQKPYFYIVNMTPKGFVLIANDTRVSPLLAISTENNFDNSMLFPEADSLQEGLNNWIDMNITLMDKIEETQETVPEVIIDEWASYYKVGVIKLGASETNSREMCCSIKQYPCDDIPCKISSGGGGDPCPPIVTQFGHLITAKWRQICGFNSECTTNNCQRDCKLWGAGTDNNKKAGCFSIAAGQISYYWKFPSVINNNTLGYSLMDDVTPNIQSARLIRGYGVLANTKYFCNLGATTGNAGKNAIQAVGFQSSGYDNFNLNTIATNIKNRQPVLLLGFDNCPSFLNLSSGHFWVCDGYRETTKCNNVNKQIHMNWGHGGGGNGWYNVLSDKYYSFTEDDAPAGYYNTYTCIRMLHNIKP